MTLWPPDQPLSPLCDSARELRAMVSRLEGSAVSVLDVGVIVLRPGLDLDGAARVVDTGRMLGADRVIVMNQDPDATRSAAHLAEICEIAAGRGVRVAVEFMPYTATPTLVDATDLLATAGRSNGGLVVDLLHLYRSGSSVHALAGMDPEMLHLVQVCDARRPAPPMHRLRWEALHDRMYPGEGALPVAAAVAALPDTVPVTVEAPVARDAGREPVERARAAAAAVRLVEAQTGTNQAGH